MKRRIRGLLPVMMLALVLLMGTGLQTAQTAARAVCNITSW